MTVEARQCCNRVRGAAFVAGLVAAAAAGAVIVVVRRRRHRRQIIVDTQASSQQVVSLALSDVEAEELLEQVRQKSKAVMYIVTNSSATKFSLKNLTKYLRMKGVEPFEGASSEESIFANARKLLILLDSAGAPEPSAAMKSASRLRHELVQRAISPTRLQELLPRIKESYVQQALDYGRNSRYGDKWRISCYLVVMENWKPKILPHEPMVDCLGDVMWDCVGLFQRWYCTRRLLQSVDVSVMNAFVTRYRPINEEDQLKKHIDGSNVDGSVILALPTDDAFEGGDLHVWDSKPEKEFRYCMGPGDVIFLENAVWHQAKPITSGTRWALVLFLRLRDAVPVPADEPDKHAV